MLVARVSPTVRVPLYVYTGATPFLTPLYAIALSVNA